MQKRQRRFLRLSTEPELTWKNCICKTPSSAPSPNGISHVTSAPPGGCRRRGTASVTIRIFQKPLRLPDHVSEEIYGDDFLALRVFLRHRHRTGESYKRGIYNRLGLIVGFLLCARVFCFWLVCFFLSFFTLVLFSFQKEDRYVIHFIHFLRLNFEQKIEPACCELSCPGSCPVAVVLIHVAI